MRPLLALSLGIALAGATGVGAAHAASTDSTAQQVAYGAGSFFGAEPVQFVGQ